MISDRGSKAETSHQQRISVPSPVHPPPTLDLSAYCRSTTQTPYGNQEVLVKRPQPKKTGGVVGVAWYREADWPRIKELFPDADKLHDSYAEWLKFAEDSVTRLRRSGMTVEPFTIDIDDFL